MGILCFTGSSSSSTSTLLCGEDKSSILGPNAGEEEGEVGGWGPMDGFLVWGVQSEEFVGLLMEKEREHLPDGGYLERLSNGGLESSWRSDAIDWICKVHAYYSFGPVSVYLSVNYLDRFLSSYQIPHDKSWMQQLLSVACLSLAVKMEETQVPPSLDLQVGDDRYVFEARTIKRMELLVLSTLKWRMQAVTPFSFISCFLDKFNEGKPPSYALVSRCAELIVGTLKGTKYLQFRPSEIAAAAVLSAVAETRVLEFGSALATSEIPANKERVLRCHEVMQEKALVKKSVPQSPIGVLDAAWLSSRSDATTVGSSKNSSSSSNQGSSSPASKRRKLSTTPI